MAKLLVVFLVLCATLSCFAAPVVQSIGSDVPISTTYTTVITVVGTGFTGATQVKISGITCGSVVVHSATEIECVAQPGLGSGNEVSVKVGSNIGSAKVLDFEAATSHACGSTPLDLFSSSTTKAVVSICGSNFGDSSYTTDDSDWTGTLQVVAGKKVKSQGTITYHDDSVLVVEFSSGTGQKNPVFVVLGTQNVEVPDLLVTFDPPTVSAVVEDNRRAVVVTDIVRLAIYGRNFGTPSPTTIVQVNVGGFKCNVNLVHVSDTLIRCSVKNGFGANRDVEVISNGYSSNTVIQIGNHTTSPVSIVSPVRYDFPNAFVPGFDCAPPSGAVDVVNPDMCNCWSGYAPLSAQPGTECSVRAVCPGKVASKTTANFFGPSRPTYKFEDDTLWIVQTQPIVANRRDTLIEFVVPNIPHRNPNNAPGFPGAPTCMYPGVLWEKKINELDCLDEFHGRMPWSQNEFCGWVEDTDVENLDNHVQKFKTSMVTTYTETYKGTDGKLRFRKMSNSYLLTVSFTRQIVAFTTSHVNVYINEPSYNFNVEVQDDAFYDVASHQVLINFVTTVAWPYQLDDLTLLGNWRRVAGGTEGGSVLAEAVLNQQPGDLECTTDQDTDCSQSWLLTISGDACDLHGSLEFSTGTLLCRDLVENDAVNCMFTTSTNFTIQIGKTDLCDNAPDVDATEGLTHSMESFYDQAHTIPQNTFQTGDMIYFIVRLNDPISSIDSVTFNSISVASTGDHDDLYAVQTAGDLPTDPDTTILSVAQVNVTREIRQPTDVIAPGTDAILTFQFRLLRNHLDSLDNLAASYESSVSLTLTAIVDIWYHGNQKRTISLEGSASSTAHASISYYSVESELEEIPTEQNNAQADAEGWTDEISFFSNASTIYSTSVVFIAGAMIALLF